MMKGGEAGGRMRLIATNRASGAVHCGISEKCTIFSGNSTNPTIYVNKNPRKQNWIVLCMPLLRNFPRNYGFDRWESHGSNLPLQISGLWRVLQSIRFRGKALAPESGFLRGGTAFPYGTLELGHRPQYCWIWRIKCLRAGNCGNTAFLPPLIQDQ